MQSDSHGALDSPAVTVTDITEPTAVNAGMELIDQDAVQLESKPLRARRVIVRLDGATVVLYTSNRRVRTATRVHDGLLAYVTFGPRAHGTVNGLPVKPGFMLAAAPGAEGLRPQSTLDSRVRKATATACCVCIEFRSLREAYIANTPRHSCSGQHPWDGPRKWSRL